jgi:hypothetical protein
VIEIREFLSAKNFENKPTVFKLFDFKGTVKEGIAKGTNRPYKIKQYVIEVVDDKSRHWKISNVTERDLETCALQWGCDEIEWIGNNISLSSSKLGQFYIWSISPSETIMAIDEQVI